MAFDTGSAVALLLVTAFAICLGIAWVVVAIRRLAVPECFRCPFLRCDVEVSFEEWGGHRQDVLRCSAFRSAREIDCGKRCLEMAPAHSANVA